MMEREAGRVEDGGFTLSFVAVLGSEESIGDVVDLERKLYEDARMPCTRHGLCLRRPGLRPA